MSLNRFISYWIKFEGVCLCGCQSCDWLLWPNVLGEQLKGFKLTLDVGLASCHIMRFRDDPAGGLLLSILTAVVGEQYTMVEEIFVRVVVYGGPVSLDCLGDNLVYGLSGWSWLLLAPQFIMLQLRTL